MSAIGKAGDLLDIMRVRLRIQQAGLSNPRPSVKSATERLVQKLVQIDPSEEIEVGAFLGNARYVRVSTGEILAEFDIDENT